MGPRSAARTAGKEPTIPLFVVEHRHDPDASPTAAGRGSRFLEQVSAAVAARHGVTIEAEAFLRDEYRFLLVVEAPNREAVERFLDFLRPLGDPQVLPASTAEEAVRRHGCEPSPEPGTTGAPV